LANGVSLILTLFFYLIVFYILNHTPEPSLEEQLFLQQAGYGAGAGSGSSAALYNQLRDQNMLSQLGQQQHLAALLGFSGSGGGGGGGGGGSDSMRQALAAQLRQQQQQQQQQQFSQADLLALSRSGALSGLLGGGGGSGFGGGGGGGAYGSFGSGGGGGGGGGAGFTSELEGLQRLEELQRRQRLLQAAAASEGPRQGLERTLASMGQRDGIGGAADGSPSRGPNKQEAAMMGAGMPSMEGMPSKDDLEKTPGSVIVPCRARGMPMDHNFKVRAWFVDRA